MCRTVGMYTSLKSASNLLDYVNWQNVVAHVLLKKYNFPPKVLEKNADELLLQESVTRLRIGM